jgi:hypothetical protein
MGRRQTNRRTALHPKEALEISGAIRQTRALMLEQINSSIPWPLLAVLVFYWRGQSELGDGSV